MLVGGTAMADPERWRGRDTSHHSGGTVVRDSRYRDTNRDRPRYRQDYRRDRSYNRVRIDRRPVYLNNGRFVFHGGYTRAYNRPVIRQRYYDYRYRPSIVVENYDAVPGYIWVQGSWSWNGYEWIWQNGYYAPDPNWTEPYYSDSYYGNGGVHIQGSVHF